MKLCEVISCEAVGYLTKDQLGELHDELLRDYGIKMKVDGPGFWLGYAGERGGVLQPWNRTLAHVRHSAQAMYKITQSLPKAAASPTALADPRCSSESPPRSSKPSKERS